MVIVVVIVSVSVIVITIVNMIVGAGDGEFCPGVTGAAGGPAAYGAVPPCGVAAIGATVGAVTGVTLAGAVPLL